jgi:hypothetical protein
MCCQEAEALNLQSLFIQMEEKFREMANWEDYLQTSAAWKTMDQLRIEFNEIQTEW